MNYDVLANEFVKESLPLWEGFWEKISPNQQRILFAVAANQPVHATDYQIAGLFDTSLIYEDQNGNLHPFSEEFGRFVLSRRYDGNYMAIQPGRVIANRYQVTHILGMGNYNQVARALDRNLNREVVLKFVYFDHQFPEELAAQIRSRLEREAVILAQLNHPNIGKVHDVLSDPLGIVMEWIQGSSLQEVVDHPLTLSADRVVDIGLKMAEALTHVHGKDIVHRDIKPGNIVIRAEDGEPVLIDFGIARAPNLKTITLLADGTHGYLGTRRYSAPEQLLSIADADAPCDLFALGVVLYQVLTGKFPFEYGNLAMHYGDHLPKPDQEKIPDALYAILCDLLLEEPKSRLTAAELNTRLGACRHLEEGR